MEPTSRREGWYCSSSTPEISCRLFSVRLYHRHCSRGTFMLLLLLHTHCTRTSDNCVLPCERETATAF